MGHTDRTSALLVLASAGQIEAPEHKSFGQQANDLE
jgi:hypothetical protein